MPRDGLENAAEMGQGVTELSRLRVRPIGFLWHYVCRHPWGHSIVFTSVLVAVICAVSTQYGLKHLIDIVAAGPSNDGRIWWAFALLCGLVAAVVHVITNPYSRTPTIGASGAIAGVMGAFIVTYPRDRVKILVFFWWFVRVTVIPAAVLIGVWFLIQLFSQVGAIASAQSGGVAYMTHVGGFIFGAATARLFEGFRRVAEPEG